MLMSIASQDTFDKKINNGIVRTALIPKRIREMTLPTVVIYSSNALRDVAHSPVWEDVKTHKIMLACTFQQCLRMLGTINHEALTPSHLLIFHEMLIMDGSAKREPLEALAKSKEVRIIHLKRDECPIEWILSNIVQPQASG
jgi:hypothetical protein